MPMETFMKDSGKMTWRMVMELFKILKMPLTQVSG